MNAERLAEKIDHTLLSPNATSDQFRQLCREAVSWGCHGVCVPSSRIELAVSETESSDVRVSSVVGFPLGHMDADSKRYETEMAVDLGAHEIDMVINVGRVLDREAGALFRELRDVVEAADERPVKVILETGFLSREDLTWVVEIFKETGAHFVKTSTGFGPRGATLEDVRFLREQVGPRYGVKAAGGIKGFESALALVDAGADRLGLSATVSVLEALREAGEGGGGESHS